MENDNKEIENLSKKNGVYQLNIENMCIEMTYSQNNKKFTECIFNILKRRVKTE